MYSVIFPELPTVRTASFRFCFARLQVLKISPVPSAHFLRRCANPVVRGTDLVYCSSTLLLPSSNVPSGFGMTWVFWLSKDLSTQAWIRLVNKFRAFLSIVSSSVENRALLVARACEDRQLVNALAHFALQIREYRISRKMVSAPLLWSR